VKLQCDLCKEIVAADLAIVGDAIEVTCPACKGTFTAPARGSAPVVELARARAARRTPEDGEPSMTCPKCGDLQPPGAACRTCGLLAERMADFRADLERSVPPEVLAAWEQVSASWSDLEAHERFVRTATTAMAYAWAAQRYRDALRLRPDDTVAAERLAKVAKMAEATLLASSGRKPTAGPRPYKKVTMLLLALLAVAVLGIVYALVVSRTLGDEGEELRPARKAPVRSPTRPPKGAQPAAGRDAGPRGP